MASLAPALRRVLVLQGSTRVFISVYSTSFVMYNNTLPLPTTQLSTSTVPPSPPPASYPHTTHSSRFPRLS